MYIVIIYAQSMSSSLRDLMVVNMKVRTMQALSDR